MPALEHVPPWFLLAFGVPFGLIWGSFLNVVIHRLPRGESVAFPPSTCPSCGARIAAYDNVPLLSFALLRGRARCCAARISARYPLVELLGGLLSLAVLRQIVLELPPGTPLGRALAVYLLYFAFGLALIALAFIDLEHMLLPDSLTLGGAALGLVGVALRPIALSEALIGAAFGFLLIWLPFDFVYSRFRGTPGMGLGDAKLALCAGAWFGWKGPLFVLLAGAIQATVAVIALYAARGRIDEPEAVRLERAEAQARLEAATGEERVALERELALDPVMQPPEPGLAKARLPFGPFLALAALEYLFLEDMDPVGSLFLGGS